MEHGRAMLRGSGSRSCQAEAELTTPMRVSTYNEGLLPHGDAAVAQIAQWQASLSGRRSGGTEYEKCQLCHRHALKIC